MEEKITKEKFWKEHKERWKWVSRHFTILWGFHEGRHKWFSEVYFYSRSCWLDDGELKKTIGWQGLPMRFYDNFEALIEYIFNPIREE